jgi:hypothetical protein
MECQKSFMFSSNDLSSLGLNNKFWLDYEKVFLADAE